MDCSCHLPLCRGLCCAASLHSLHFTQKVWMACGGRRQASKSPVAYVCKVGGPWKWGQTETGRTCRGGGGRGCVYHCQPSTPFCFVTSCRVPLLCTLSPGLENAPKGRRPSSDYGSGNDALLPSLGSLRFRGWQCGIRKTCTMEIGCC